MRILDRIFAICAIGLLPTMAVSLVIAEYIAKSESNLFWYATILTLPFYVGSFVACMYHLFGSNRVTDSRIGWLLALIGGFLVGFYPLVLPLFWYFKIHERNIPKAVA